MIFTKENYKITLALIVLILALSSCNIIKFYNKLTNNTETFFDTSTTTTTTTTIPTTIPTTTIPTTTIPTVSSRYNEISYGVNPECIKAELEPVVGYCPNEHPNIPCNKECEDKKSKLTDEMKRTIYMYIYLTGLLKSTTHPDE